MAVSRTLKTRSGESAAGGTMAPVVGYKYASGDSYQDIGGYGSGTSKDAGYLGQGQFKAATSPIDKSVFGKEVQLDPLALAQAAQIDQAKQDQFRGRQMSLADALQAQSMGQGPSLAQMQLQQGLNQNVKNQMALAATQRGGSPGLAQRQLAQNIAGANQQAAMQAAQTRMAEQMQAREQLGGVLQGGRGQDIGLATSQADLQQQTALANMGAQNQYSLNKANVQAQNIKSLQDYEKLVVDQQAQANAQNQAAYESASKRRGETAGKVGTAVASMASDINLKKNIKKVKEGEDDGKKISGKEHFENQARKYGGEIAAAFSDERKKRAVAEVVHNPEDSEKKDDPLSGVMNMFAQSGEGSSGAGADSMMSSDEKEKSGAVSSDSKLQKFLDAIQAYVYEYKDPEKFGSGKHISPMAQDIEKSELGKPGIVETSDGKMVDYGKLGGVMLASQSLMNKRLNGLEEALRARKK